MSVLGRQWDELPAEPGTTPIPKGHVRLFHYTRPDALPSIRTQGLVAQEESKSARVGEPALVWAKEDGGDLFDYKPVVEFHVPKEEWETGGALGLGRAAIKGPVSPRNIIAIHEPWHRQARLLQGMHTSAEISQGALKQYPDYDPEFNKAVNYLERNAR